MTDPFLTRLNLPELKKLHEHKGSVDALHLVSFSGAARRYRWYGLLISFAVLLRGGRPIFAGTCETSVVGKKTFDEIVIIRYPGLRTFTGILTGRYWSLLNRIREKGVRYFEFSFTRPFRESSVLWKKGCRLVILFNFREGTFGDTLDKITNILGKYPVIQLYASKKIADIPFKGMPRPLDPNPATYEGIVIFSVLGDTHEGFTLGEDVFASLNAHTTGMTIQIYRSLSIWESMPWSK
jgi:hypothetical protein